MIDDLILRSVINAPLTTKGTELTWAELDDNIVTIYNALNELYNSSSIPAYSNAITYDDTVLNYVVYNSRIYKFINAIPAINVTPDTDPLTWLLVFASDVAHRRNTDTILDEGGVDEISAADIKAYIDSTFIYKIKITVTSAEILALNTTPVLLITHVNNKFIRILSFDVRVLYGTTPYATYDTINVYTDTANKAQFTAKINASTSIFGAGAQQVMTNATDNQYVVNGDIYLTSAGGNPTAGDSDIQVYITYQLLG